MSDLQTARAEYAEILDRDSETSRNLTCRNWLIARRTRAEALIAAYEAELLRRGRCGNCCLSWDAGGVCSGSPGGRCKHATPDNPHGKWRLQE